MSLITDIYQRRELLSILVVRNLKIRYRNSALGFFWSLLTPLFLILIYAVFAKLLKFSMGMPNYLQFLIIGIVCWQFLMMCLNDSLNAIMGNANLVKKTAFPRIILPLAMVKANLVNFLLTLVVLMVYLFFAGMEFSHLAWLPVVIVTHFALCLGIALILCTANVYFRDTEHILQILTLGWFFMTPIFYPVSFQMDFLPESLNWLVFLNPMSGLICSYRGIWMSQPMPPLGMMAVSYAICWMLPIIGLLIFQKYESGFADEL